MEEWMRALVATPGSQNPAEIREVDEPIPADDEVVIDVHNMALNRGEIRLLSMRSEWRPGQDIAGTVAEAARDGSGPPVGTRVSALVDQSGWAEKVAAPAGRVGVLPDGVSFSAGAALGVAGLTALRALRMGGSLLGARVFVTGAAGGVGRFAVQLARHGGADVTAVVGSRERAEGLSELGASDVVLESDDIEGDFDIVLEGVSGPGLQRSVHALAPGGVMVIYGAASQQPGSIGFFDFSGRPHTRIEAFFIYESGTETFGRDITYLARLVGEKKLVAPIGLETSWTDLGAAVEALANRRVNGKAILSID
jgi:NADPH:quinone reductase